MAKTKRPNRKGYYLKWSRARREKIRRENPKEKKTPMTSTERSQKRRKRLNEIKVNNINNPSSMQTNLDDQPSTSGAAESLQQKAQTMPQKCHRVNQFQKDYLVNYLENNKDLANNKFKTADDAKLRFAKWETLGAALNNLVGTTKTGEMWRKYWLGLRLNTQNKYRALRESAEHNGTNGSRRTKALTSYEEKIVHITTEEATDGNDTPEVGSGDSTFIIYDDCGAESSEYILKEVKCEIPDAETTTSVADAIETKTFVGITTAEITDDDVSTVTTSEDRCRYSAESSEYFFEEIKCEMPEAETTTAIADAKETKTFEAITAAEIRDDDVAQATTAEDLAKIAINQFDFRAKRARREMQENEDHLEKHFTIEEKKLEAMQVSNDLMREQIKVIKQQTEAIRADTEMKRYFCIKLEEAIVAFKAKS